jgi:hypothetical protein
MCSSAVWCPSLRSWEAAVVKVEGKDGLVLRINEQESVAATEVMEALPVTKGSGSRSSLEVAR